MRDGRLAITSTNAARRDVDAARRFWVGVGRVVLTVCVAVGVAWVGLRVNRGADETMIDPDVEGVLKVYLGDVKLKVESLEGALAELSRLSGVGLELDVGVRENFSPVQAEVDPSGPPPMPLTLKGVELGTALGAVLRQFDCRDRQLDFAVSAGKVRVVSRRDLGDDDDDDLIVRAYDIGDLIDAGVADPAILPSPEYRGDRRRYAYESLVWAIDVALPTETAHDPLPVGVEFVGDHMVVRKPAHVHRNVQRVLLMLRYGGLAKMAPATAQRVGR